MAKLRRTFKVGDKFTLKAGETDQYPEEYHNGRVFTVSGVFDHHVPAKDMHNDPTGHPGFDGGSGSCLYEADDLPFALYDWEMESA